MSQNCLITVALIDMNISEKENGLEENYRSHRMKSICTFRLRAKAAPAKKSRLPNAGNLVESSHRMDRELLCHKCSSRFQLFRPFLLVQFSFSHQSFSYNVHINHRIFILTQNVQKICRLSTAFKYQLAKGRKFGVPRHRLCLFKI